jgi:hypothetical protein
MNKYIDTNIKIVQVEENSTPIKILKDLIEFIEENAISDERHDDGECIEEWRSAELEHLINKAKEIIKKELKNKQLINKIRKVL